MSSPVPIREEGRCAPSPTLGRQCGGRSPYCSTGNAAADCEGVWSWRPWAGAKSVEAIPQATVTMRSRTPGRARTTPLKTIAQGMSMFRLRLWFLTRVLSLLHTRLRVQPNTRHSLRPLLFEDVGSCKTRTRRVAGMLARNLTPHTPSSFPDACPESLAAARGLRAQAPRQTYTRRSSHSERRRIASPRNDRSG
jgi:hypothetical protein